MLVNTKVSEYYCMNLEIDDPYFYLDGNPELCTKIVLTPTKITIFGLNSYSMYAMSNHDCYAYDKEGNLIFDILFENRELILPEESGGKIINNPDYRSFSMCFLNIEHRKSILYSLQQDRKFVLNLY